MSILKFKNADGTWNGIAAFKGENGKDGVVQYKAGNGIKIENDTITAEVTKQYVDKSIAELTDMGFTPEVVESLPTENIKTNIIYMLPAQTSEAENIYEEWMYINNKWEMVGSTSVDLSNYYTKDETNNKLDTKQNKLTPGENITIDENNVISASGGKTKFYSFYTGLKYNFQRPSNIYLSEMSVDNREKFKALLSNIITEIGTTENKDAMLLVQFQCSNYIQGLPYLIFSMGNNHSMDTTRTTFDMISVPNYANNRLMYQYSLEITGAWDNGVFNAGNAMFTKESEETFLSIKTGLAKDNTTSYTPTSDYHPATKIYVDKAIENVNNELSMLPQNLVDNGFDYNTHEQVNVQVNYTIENISTPYGFELNENGYYESNNKNAGNSYSLCKVTFNNEKLLSIPISYINYGERGYDYGIFGNIDKELSNNNADDGDTGSEKVFKNCKGESSADVKEIIYDIPAGEHFIYIKYRKDGSGDNANDSLQFKIPTEIVNDIYENRKMATTKYVDDAVSGGSAKGYYYVEAPMGALGIGNEYNESNTLPETCHQVFKDFIDTINSNNVREPKLIVANTVDETTDVNGNPITNPMPRYIELSNLHKDTTAEVGKSHYILKGVCNTPRGAKNANGDDIDFIATVDIVGVDSDTGFTVENVFVYLGVYTMPSASSGKTNYLGYIEDYTPDNRLDITNLEKGTYSLGIKDRIESQTLYLKVLHNGQEQTLDTKLQIEATVVSNMVYFEVRNPIKDISGYDEAIRISFSYLNSITGEIINTKYGISYNNTSGILSNSARYNTKISAATTDTEQTIRGKKTFNVLPESSVEPTNNNQFVNKKYVDDSLNNIPVSEIPMDIRQIHISNSEGGYVYGSGINILSECKDTIDSIINEQLNNPVVYLSFDNPGVAANKSYLMFPSEKNNYYPNTNTNAAYYFNTYNHDYKSGGADTGLFLYVVTLEISGSWKDGVFTTTRAMVSATGKYNVYTINQSKSNFLAKTNTKEFTPTADYHPATKKYVDDAVAGVSGGISSETDPIFSASEAYKITASDTANWNNKVDATQVNNILDSKSYLTSETDPTVPAWAKQPNKPTYTASEVGALPASTVIPTVPTKLSELTDDLGTSPTHSHSQYLTAHQDISGKQNKVLYGTADPTSDIGVEGDIYVKYV